MGGGNIAGDMNLMLSHCVALGLCRETQDEEVAAEQVAETVRALEAKALAAEQEVAAIQARESARLDAKLADVRRRHPFLSLERCAASARFRGVNHLKGILCQILNQTPHSSVRNPHHSNGKVIRRPPIRNRG